MLYSTYEDAKDALKDRLADYLTSKGININKPFNCLNPAHTDNKPSMSYDKKRNKVHCFSCNVDYDIIDLIQADYGITDIKEAFKKGYELYGIEPPENKPAQNQPKNEQYTHNKHNTDNTYNTYNKTEYMTKPDSKPDKDLMAYFKKCSDNISNTSYLKDRGISDKTALAYNIGYDSNFKQAGVDWEALIIPTSESTFVVRNTDLTATDRYRKVGSTQLFNIKECEGTDAIFIVEGEIDALSIIEAGYKAVALGSTSNARKFIDYVIDKKPKNTFILALDADEAGDKAEKEIAEKLKGLGIKHMKAVIYGDSKDANEALQKDKQGFISSLKEAVEDAKNPEEAEKKRELREYKKNYASSSIKDFLDGIKAKANTPYIPTGFKTLDATLDGGLFEGLYFIGAISSLGKTTFTLQIADQIAQQGYDVIIFSLEMAKSELIAKSISRLTLLKSENTTNAKTTRGITTYSRYPNYSETEKRLINTAIKAYSDYADKIVMHEGQGEIGIAQIREAVETHIRLTGNKPVVIIDYLQIIAPYNDRATDKQNTDKAVTELKRISRDNKISILAISSLNRENYTSKISMQAFKESGAIEYSSDVLIGLQFKGAGEKDFDIDEAKKKSNDADSPRDIELKILKNRNGRTGDAIAYKYYPLFNYFREV